MAPTDGTQESEALPIDFAVTLLETMPDAVVYADRSGMIRYWNKGAEGMFGFTADEAIGQSLDLIIPEGLRARHWDGYERTMETGHSKYAAGELLSVPAAHKTGTRLSAEFTIVPFRDAAGQMIGVAAIMRDQTQRFQEMRALRKAAATP
ncbi:MAG: PAS domain S-box protein [Proteobacteria bacterium]|nr:PAS domain S-box protein [Pseudomonadota bacterium]